MYVPGLHPLTDCTHAHLSNDILFGAPTLFVEMLMPAAAAAAPCTGWTAGLAHLVN